jgi:hypothetical protein
MSRIAIMLALSSALLVTGCASSPPDQVHDACLILEDNRAWWRDLQRTERPVGRLAWHPAGDSEARIELQRPRPPGAHAPA